jgi:1,2-diacylglycerol 3-alpha-glucosyltransferase
MIAMPGSNARLSTKADPQSLRIGLFSESFHPVQNGVTTSVLTLVAGLRALSHHVWVFAPAHQEQTEPETNVLRFPSFVTVFNREYPLAYPFLPRLALATHFNRLRLDIVHTHTPFVLGLTGAKLALSRGVPLVSTFHTLYSQYSHYMPLLPDSVTQSLLEYYLPWYYNRCVEIICPSLVAANALREQGVESPIEVIPTGIPLPSRDSISRKARLSVRESLCIAPEAPVVLFAGRLAREKNVGWLLEAFCLIRAKVPETRLVIAGGGPNAEELQMEAQNLGLQNSVLFLGPTPRRQMDGLFAAADVFCFPSPSETQGLVIGEARAAGTPSVVVDAGGAAEAVEDGIDGFRVPVEDQAAFAAKTVQILTDKKLHARLRANALRNAQNFTPERMVQRVLMVYQRAREDTRPPKHGPHPIFGDEMDWESGGWVAKYVPRTPEGNVIGTSTRGS